MAEDYAKKLQSLLRKLFQFESADLDFGIYRIMNKKRDVINRFIEKDLIAAVNAEFGKVSLADKAQLVTEVEALAGELGIGVDDDPAALRAMAKKVPALQPLITKFEKKRTDLLNLAGRDEHKAEVFNHIYQFFSRYYDNGDFMSMRRYSAKQKFAVPYNGEEVLLHWANKDQYYIKTGEYFFNYAFRVGEYTVRFQIVQAETSVNNTKGENRFFILKSGDGTISYDAKAKELVILFEYRALTKSEEESLGTRNKLDALNEQAKAAILAAVPDAGLKAGLTRETEGKIPLAKHLATYAKRNTTDYFIHKDLAGFLTQELDFYIKNEMFDLDDLGSEKEVPIEQYLNRVRVMKAISLKIITFLAQIEDFQKKLFEKKKFVMKSEYCMTLDRIPEEFYPEIVENAAQIAEWKALYSVGESSGQTTLSGSKGNVIDEEFLKSHPYLVLDTIFFPQEFKNRLLSTFDNLDEATGGLMVKSENWQALNLLQERYREQVKCIYIDPPYNTGSDEFLYKDGYCHSSWLSNLQNRISLSKNMLYRDKGVIACSIDKHEMFRAKILFDSLLGEEFFVNSIVNINNPKGRSDQKHIPTAHENILFYAQNLANTYGWYPEEKVTKRYSKKLDTGEKYRELDLRKTGDADKREDRPNMYYPFYFNQKTGEFFPSQHLLNADELIEILPIKDDDTDGRWRWGIETSRERIIRLKPKFMPIRKKWTVIEIDILEDTERVMPTSVWGEKNFNSERATESFINLGFNKEDFPRPKTVGLMYSLFLHTTKSNDIIIDFFAGSGTTSQGLIDLNREDGENRKYILVEMADYFNTVMKPRIKKVIYPSEWKDGKPQNTDGISHIFKYLILEQYEDTLNNIEFQEAGTVQKTLMDMEGYLLHYMLDFETRESPCRMNVTKLERPFKYTLQITRDNELHNDTVDLVETFNYLLGLKVKRIRTFMENGTTYRVVHGETLLSQPTTIVWRTTVGLDLKKDKEFIEGTLLKDPKFKAERIFINSDFHVEGALPIEPEFQRLMGA
jgi:adenine-specific DNA-methyltransferase